MVSQPSSDKVVLPNQSGGGEMRILVSRAAMVLFTVLMAGCDQSAAPSTNTGLQIHRTVDTAQVVRGKSLFAQHCARCHGEMAQGDPFWRQRNPDGTFPPPPLDSSGHAWHHSHEWLHEVIITGTEPQGHMPAWGGKLNDQEIDDIIAWFQSLWTDEVYAAWWEMERRNHTSNQ